MLEMDIFRVGNPLRPAEDCFLDEEKWLVLYRNIDDQDINQRHG